MTRFRLGDKVIVIGGKPSFEKEDYDYIEAITITSEKIKYKLKSGRVRLQDELTFGEYSTLFVNATPIWSSYYYDIKALYKFLLSNTKYFIERHKIKKGDKISWFIGKDEHASFIYKNKKEI